MTIYRLVSSSSEHRKFVIIQSGFMRSRFSHRSDPRSVKIEENIRIQVLGKKRMLIKTLLQLVTVDVTSDASINHFRNVY